MSDAPAPIDPELVGAFVGKAHGDLEFVRNTLASHPTIVNAAWDWGGGDWETALGAAAHMGRKDIAQLLLENGARIDIFAAAMLGDLQTVKAIVAFDPGSATHAGPHGIPLTVHAMKGGEDAASVLEYLASLG